MLDRLRDRAAQILAETHICTVATTGPAGIQASTVPCAARGTTLYLLVPDTSDHLFNLEVEPEVAVTAQTWQMRGVATLVKEGADLFSPIQCQWQSVVRIRPLRLHILPEGGALTYVETIDFDPESGG